MRVDIISEYRSSVSRTTCWSRWFKSHRCTLQDQFTRQNGGKIKPTTAPCMVNLLANSTYWLKFQCYPYIGPQTNSFPWSSLINQPNLIHRLPKVERPRKVFWQFFLETFSSSLRFLFSRPFKTKHNPGTVIIKREQVIALWQPAELKEKCFVSKWHSIATRQ